jgi:hypothetical protein
MNLWWLGKVSAAVRRARVSDLLVSVASFQSIKEDMRGSKIVIFSWLKEETNIDTRTAIVKRQKK